MSEASTPKELIVMLYSKRIGVLREHADGRHTFTYDTDQAAPVNDVGTNAIQLSFSMPRRARPWSGTPVEAYIDNILPDERSIRRRIANLYGVNANNPFSMLTAIGLDCAGAVQFVQPESLEVLDNDMALEPISEDQIGERLHAMTQGTEASWLYDGEHWSLNGAQDKIALRKCGQQWFVPHGAQATTHIIKPGIKGLHHQAFNEYVCMKTLETLKIPVAHTEFHCFGAVPALISTRWDRRADVDANGNEIIRRVHQEDMCQALGVMSANKYQSDGGPSATDIVALLRANDFSNVDVYLFFTALVVNFLIAGSDAHAKNYAILEPQSDMASLAPLYDVASLYCYATQRRQRRLAMSIGGEYRYEFIELRHWQRLATSTGGSDDWAFIRFALQYYATELPKAFDAAAEIALLEAQALHAPNRHRFEEPVSASSPHTPSECMAEHKEIIERIRVGIEAQCDRVLQWFR